MVAMEDSGREGTKCPIDPTAGIVLAKSRRLCGGGGSVGPLQNNSTINQDQIHTVRDLSRLAAVPGQCP